ncbi:MAG: hypothetical protein BMS9Abin22_437 [Gammaproteobacteria bacterium]|nr:MAG: hypothetical protein BMS9Abin22_437 [Gammaproteobacteria bacterium]
MTQVNMAFHPGMMPLILGIGLALAAARARETNFAIQPITSRDFSDYSKQEWR